MIARTTILLWVQGQQQPKLYVLISHPRQPAVSLSHALRHFCGEALVVGAKENIVVRHQRGGAYGRDPSRGVDLPQCNAICEMRYAMNDD